MEKEHGKHIDKLILFTVLIIVGVISLFLIFNPGAGQGIVNTVLGELTDKFDWLFEWTAIALMLFLVWLAFSKYGKIKMGKKDGEPEFSDFNWVAMIFTAGIGAALIYWAMLEPMYYFQGPPFGIEAESAQAAEWSVMYGMFHWGLSAWAFYTLPGIVIAYSYYIKKQPQLKPSVACRGIIGDYADGYIGRIIDIIVMLGLIGGTGTTLGSAVPMVSIVASEIFNIPNTIFLKLVILILWIVLFTISAYFGLYKGIKNLANINLKLIFGLLGFIFLFGAPWFILSNTTNSIGLQLQNFIRMSLWTDPISKGGFPQAWTVFYWAWWVAYSVYMGLWIARISKNRTIREIIMGVGVFGTLGCWIFFAVFGSYTIHVQISGILDVTNVLANASEAVAIIPAVLQTLPLSVIILPVFVIIALIFSATTLDSSAYTLASMTYKTIYADDQPHRWNRLLWSLVLGFMSISLMYVGGLDAVKLSSVLLALPEVIVIVLFVLSLIKWLNEDYKQKMYPESNIVGEEVAESIGTGENITL